MKGLLRRGLPGAQRSVRNECYPECELLRVNVVYGHPNFQKIWNDMIPHRFYTRVFDGI